MENVAGRSPERTLVSIREAYTPASFPAREAARSITGNNIFIDAGFHLAGL